MVEPALSLRGVEKSFGGRRAVDGISFDVAPGEVVALLGPNGAGKTTTVEMCEGFQRPDAGEIQLLGMNPTVETDRVRQRVGIMLQGGGSYPTIRVGEMLSLLASYSKNPIEPQWLLETVGLDHCIKTPYRRLSGGQQQRLSLACALINRPEMVFLDEPTAGMDAQSRLTVWDMVSSLRRDGVTVLLTTHLMDEAEALADKVIILDRGQVVAQGTMSELTESTEARISFTTSSGVDIAKLNHAVASSYTADSLVTATRPNHYSVDGVVSPELIAAITRAVAEQDVLITELGVDHRSLEDVFLDITGREMRVS